MSREELMEAVHGADALTFDPEDTQFSKYALPGGTNYTESFSTYQPNIIEPGPDLLMDPVIRADINAGAHFNAGTFPSGDDIPTLFSTRSARYPVAPGGITHHVQESQSDFAQGSRSRAAGAKERNLKLDANERRASLNRQYGLGGNYDDLPGFDIGTLPPGGSQPHTINNQGLLGDTYQTDRWGPYVTSDEALTSRGNFTRTAEDTGNIAHSPATMATPEEEFKVQSHAPNTGRANNLYEDLEREYGIEPDKLEAYVPFGEGELPLTVQGRGSNKGAAWAADPRRQQLADLDKQMAEAAKLQRETLPAAPFMRTTDQWNERALKEELGKAIAAHARGEGVTHFTTGTGTQNIGLVGGKAEGQRKFYDDIQIKNLDKLLKRFGGKSQPTLMSYGEPGGRTMFDTVRGQEFTEPFVSAVRKKGIPKFAFLPLGVMGAGGLYTYGQQDENKGVPYAL
jgi:hypothetical protein